MERQADKHAHYGVISICKLVSRGPVVPPWYGPCFSYSMYIHIAFRLVAMPSTLKLKLHLLLKNRDQFKKFGTMYGVLRGAFY